MDLWCVYLGWGLHLPFPSDQTKHHPSLLQQLHHFLHQFGVLTFFRYRSFLAGLPIQFFLKDNQTSVFNFLFFLQELIKLCWLFCFSSSARMHGKSLASSMLTFESATSCFCVPDVATSAPNIVPFSVNFSSRLPQRVIMRVGTSHFSTKKWAIYANSEGNTWEACRQALSAFSFSREEEDKILGKAFGHVHSPYWGEERKMEEPKFEIVNEILEYLRSLSLSDDDLRKLLKKFPEVLGCNIEHELRTNVQILEKNWGIKGKTLKNLLLRNPKVLGYNVDCKGDCMAECTRCWVRF